MLAVLVCAVNFSLLPCVPFTHQEAEPPPEDGQAAEASTGLLQRDARAQDGYTLIAPLGSTETFLIDMQGEIAHVWGSAHATSGPVYLLDNGNLMRPAREDDNSRFRGGGVGGRLQEFSWDSELLWDYALVDDSLTQHHDVARLPNGNWLVIVWKHHTEDETIAAGRNPDVVLPAGLWADAILEIRPLPPTGGEVVWEWDSWDHLIQDFDEDLAGYASIPDTHGRIDINGDYRDQPPITEEERKRLEELEKQMAALGYTGGDEDEEESTNDLSTRGRHSDWLHTNSVNYHPELDLIVLSTPNMDEIWVIDHSTTTAEAKGSQGGRWKSGGDLLYRWGNPRTYGVGKNKDKRLYFQHDPSWLGGEAGGDLRLLLFNNRGGRGDEEFSRVFELTMPFDATRGFLRESGEAFGPEGPAWEWGAPGELYSPFISGAQRLPNGNTLICEGANGRLVEVTRGGDVVWEYVNEHFGEPSPKTTIAPSTKAGALFRATRILMDAPALQGRELE